MKDSEIKDFILDKLEGLKTELDKPEHVKVKHQYGQYLENLSSLSLEDLRLLAASNEVHSAFLATGKKETVKNLYDKFVAMGVQLEAGSSTPTNSAGTTPAAGGDSDIEKILTSVGLSPVLASGAAMLLAHVFGGDKLKWALGVGGGTMLLGWLNSEDGKKLVAQVSSAFGEGGKGFAGLLSGGAEGIGGLLGGLGEALGGIFDNPKLKEMLESAKGDPITAIAVMAGAWMVGSKLMAGDFGGVFSSIPSLLGIFAAAWLASSFLGMDKGGSKIEYDVEPLRPDQLTRLPSSTELTVAGA